MTVSKQTSYIVEVRDLNLIRIGTIEPNHILRLLFTKSLTNIGTFKLEVIAESQMSNHLIKDGAGVLIMNTDINQVVFSGIVTNYTFTQTNTDAIGVLEVTGVSDLQILADAALWPEPLNDDITTQSVANDVRSGLIEDVIYGYINDNIGQNAPIGRKGGLNSKLVTVHAQGIDIYLTLRPRFNNMYEYFAQNIGQYNVILDVVQNDDKLVAKLKPAQDLTSLIRLDVSNRTVETQNIEYQANSTTRVYIAGQGQGTQRTILDIRTEQSQEYEKLTGRIIETFDDQRNTDNHEELVQEALKTLLAAGAKYSAITVPSDDIPFMRYGQDYNVGDLIMLNIMGSEVTSRVTGSVIEVSADSTTTEIEIGETNMNNRESTILSSLRKVIDRLSELERI